MVILVVYLVKTDAIKLLIAEKDMSQANKDLVKDIEKAKINSQYMYHVHLISHL